VTPEDQDISFEFVRQQLKDSYSDNGRPSIDPELLLRILLVGYRCYRFLIWRANILRKQLSLPEMRD